jgi:hypothetical protein
MKRILIPLLVLIAADALAATGRARATRAPKTPTSAAWTAPACTATAGLPGFYFTLDEGKTVSTNPHPLPVNMGVVIVPTDVPNRLFGIVGDVLYDSADAGCTWSLRTAVPLRPSSMIAAPNGRAYAWNYYEPRLLRIAATSFDEVALPDTPKTIGVDPADAVHLVLVSRTKIYESHDAGSTWSERAAAPYIVLAAAAIDSRDVRHIAAGYTDHIGAVGRVAVSRDGGMTWQTSQTQVEGIWKLAFSPADSNVIWLHARSEAFAPLAFLRSDNGGVTFDFRLTPNFTANSLTLTPSPTEPHIAAFAGYVGLAIIDAAAPAVRLAPGAWETVTWSPAPGVLYITKYETVIKDP